MMETCYGQMGSLFRSGKSKPFPILIVQERGQVLADHPNLYMY